MKKLINNYSAIFLLLAGILVGSLIGIFAPQAVIYLKPLGDIFLNLLFVSVVPLVFFAVANSIASLEQQSKFGRIVISMIATFLLFIIISAVFTIIAVYLFPTEALPSTGGEIPESGNSTSWNDRLVSFFTVGEFTELFSRKNMLALLIFAFLTGTAVRKAGEAGLVFKNFLASGFEVMKELLLMVMKGAPVGLGAYFAYQVATMGPELFGFYAKPLGLYYVAGAVYFVIFFSIYAWIARSNSGVKSFWRNNIYP